MKPRQEEAVSVLKLPGPERALPSSLPCCTGEPGRPFVTLREGERGMLRATSVGLARAKPVPAQCPRGGGAEGPMATCLVRVPELLAAKRQSSCLFCQKQMLEQ